MFSHETTAFIAAKIVATHLFQLLFKVIYFWWQVDYFQGKHFLRLNTTEEALEWTWSNHKKKH